METRESIESKLAYARTERGKALADGRKYDSATIAQLQAQLDAFSDVEQETARRNQAAAQAAHDKDIGEKQARLAALIQDDLQDSQAAQEAAMILAAAFSRKLERVTAMARLAADITGKVGAPVCLSRPELERRLACRCLQPCLRRCR
jgi:hypothetical protein